MIKYLRYLQVWMLTVVLAAFAACRPITVTEAEAVDELPAIWPDYVGVTIPVNIAPMEFDMASGAYEAMDVLFRSPSGKELEAKGRSGIRINHKQWQALLAESSDDSLLVTVRVQQQGSWRQYRPFAMYVKSDSIDYGVTYRLIAPGYQVYSRMGIYQRSLADFKQKAIYENTQITLSCVNCHTFSRGNPEIQSVHIRGRHGATVIVKEGEMHAYNTRTDSTLASAVYPYWHPDGRYIAYSTNFVHQLFHTSVTDRMETYDTDSDVYIYDTETNTIIYNGAISNKNFFETNPAFSADGRKLYFCSTQRREMPMGVKDVRYDLCSVDFNPETGELGTQIDTLLYVSGAGRSISLPRPTYDGRFIVYAETNYGCFPLYHKESDLYILDLQTGTSRPMTELNSDYADAFHNWSSNNRWLVFGSRRDDGMHTRLYFAYVDEQGIARKPFLLPQSNPKEYYCDQMMSYNCPEFVKGEVKFDARAAGNRLYKGRTENVKVKGTR